MFNRIKQAKKKTVEFVKDNAPLIVPNVLGIAAIVYVYSNETQKRTAIYADNMERGMNDVIESNAKSLEHYRLANPIPTTE